MTALKGNRCGRIGLDDIRFLNDYMVLRRLWYLCARLQSQDHDLRQMNERLYRQRDMDLFEIRKVAKEIRRRIRSSTQVSRRAKLKAEMAIGP